MSWVSVNIAHHMFRDNPARSLADHLNEIGATFYVQLKEDANGDISGVAWVADGTNPTS